MMKQIKMTILCMISVTLILTGCVAQPKTFDDHYDLGMRYLQEGNYQEAILAFEAAIEIDDTHVRAFIGLAEAYQGKELNEQSITTWETVLKMDKTQAEAYVCLGYLYHEQGDQVSSEAILRRGYAETQNEKIVEALNALYPRTGTLVVCMATIIDNMEIYREEYERYSAQHDGKAGISAWNIRFEEPLDVEFAGGAYAVEEAALSKCYVQDGVFGEYGNDIETYLNKPMKVVGYIAQDPEWKEFIGPVLRMNDLGQEDFIYEYYPNGAFAFEVVALSPVK